VRCDNSRVFTMTVAMKKAVKRPHPTVRRPSDSGTPSRQYVDICGVTE
jgi:hypothetical protein